MIDEIVDSISKFENRITVSNSDIKIEKIDDRLKINITYSLKNSNVDGISQIIVPLVTPQEV